MEYVFFDIECACVYKNVAKICVFGYCVCDEQFHILKKEDILINPNGKFHLTDRGGGRDRVAIRLRGVQKIPRFSRRFIPRSNSFSKGRTSWCSAMPPSMTVKYLCLETRRYKLPSFTFRFADTQILYMAMTETYDRQAGLEALTQIFEIDYTPHCAADDAYATMRIAQEMCERDKCSLPELLKKYSIRFGKIENYQFNNSSSNRRNEYLREKSREKRGARRKARQVQRFRVRLPRPSAVAGIARKAFQLLQEHRRGVLPSQSGLSRRS